MKPILLGVLGALGTLAVVALFYLAYDTHRMAKRGDAAASFIENQLRQAQEQTR